MAQRTTYHGMAFIGNGAIVRLFDFDAARMCALARLFFPDEDVDVPSTVRPLLAGRIFSVLTCACQFGTAWAGLRLIHHHHDENVARQFGIRAESVGALVADVESAVPDPDRQWLHINAGLPCNDESKANPRCDPPRRSSSSYGAYRSVSRR